jgi:hypothetical protein
MARPGAAQTVDHPRVEGEWSSVVDGVQARIALAQELSPNGVPWLLPFLDLRNVGRASVEICVDSEHAKVEFVGSDGELVTGRDRPASGFGPALSFVIVPMDSYISISLRSRNRGRANPTYASAFLTTQTAAADFTEEDRGRLFVRVRLACGPRTRSDTAWIWRGSIDTPLSKSTGSSWQSA